MGEKNRYEHIKRYEGKEKKGSEANRMKRQTEVKLKQN